MVSLRPLQISRIVSYCRFESDEGVLKLIILLVRQLYCRTYARLIEGRQYNSTTVAPTGFYIMAFPDTLN